MICTVTLNASIDKSYRLAAPLADHTVMRVASCHATAGGKGLNAARAVAACGEEVVASGIVGGHTGQLLLDLLAADGVAGDFVHARGETRTCINVLDPDGGSTEFLEPGEEVTPAEVAAAREKVLELAGRADVVTVNGSIPQGFPLEAYVGLVRDVMATGTPCIVDASGERLARVVEAGPTMVKPNRDEIGQLLGREVRSMDEVATAARELVGRGVGTVVVSLGAEGALMACAEGTWRGHAPRIEVVNPVGSGDTMVGAFAVALARGMEAPERLRFAMACATANCLSPSTGSFDPAVAASLASRTEVERLG